jgi:hypothetical protein
MRDHLPMATHSITVHPSRPLEVVNADLIVEVTSDDEKLGQLQVSRGAIDWVPRGHKSAISLSWERFDQLMREAE